MTGQRVSFESDLFDRKPHHIFCLSFNFEQGFDLSPCDPLVLHQRFPYPIYDDFVYAVPLVSAFLPPGKDYAEDHLFAGSQVDRCSLCVIRDSLLPAAQGTSL